MKSLPKLVIWGASGHARVVADIVRLMGRFEIVGFLDDVSAGRRGSEFAGARILGGAEMLAELHKSGVTNLLVAVGDCSARSRLAARAKQMGFTLPTAVHPSAVVAAGVSLGAGTVVVAGSVVNPGAVIRDNVIINTAACVDHDCVIDHGAHVGPGVCLGGYVTVGARAWLGLGAIVKDRVSIGAGAIVGAGAVVLRDVPDLVVAYGVPARIRRPVSVSEANEALLPEEGVDL